MVTIVAEALISDEELDALNHSILTRYGYDFRGYERTSYKRRIQRVLYKNQMESTVDLWRKLLYDKSFFFSMKDEISVGMTEMFRNVDFWQKLVSDIVPYLSDRPKLDVWHAGCATGEEVYSAAIMWNEQNMLHKTFALATDLSDRFIKVAQKGFYDTDSFSYAVRNYERFKQSTRELQSYVDQDESGVVFKDYLRGYATFLQQNLVSETVSIDKFDLVFCRNVMIYFNDSLKMKVLQRLHSALKEGGLLCIGYFDAMPQGYTDYFDYFDSGSKIFVRK